MKPRDLRHRLEKVAKLLVIVQKHTPEVSCVVDGKDLEGRGYSFKEKKSPWLGQTTYTGRAKEKPTIVLTVPINIDRLAINEEEPERAYYFADA